METEQDRAWDSKKPLIPQNCCRLREPPWECHAAHWSVNTTFYSRAEQSVHFRQAEASHFEWQKPRWTSIQKLFLCHRYRPFSASNCNYWCIAIAIWKYFCPLLCILAHHWSGSPTYHNFPQNKCVQNSSSNLKHALGCNTTRDLLQNLCSVRQAVPCISIRCFEISCSCLHSSCTSWEFLEPRCWASRSIVCWYCFTSSAALFHSKFRQGSR